MSHYESSCNNHYINERNVPNFIKESSSKDFKKNNNKKYFRNRGIPTKKNKKYPTKSRNQYQKDKKYSRYEKYNEVNYYGNLPDIDYANWSETAILSKDNDDNDDSSIIGALLVNKNNELQITFLDSITKSYVIEPYEMPLTGIESYVWIPPPEYIEPEIRYEIIWKRLDYEFYNYERPYIYKSELEDGPSIQFYDIDIYKL